MPPCFSAPINHQIHIKYQLLCLLTTIEIKSEPPQNLLFTHTYVSEGFLILAKFADISPKNPALPFFWQQKRQFFIKAFFQKFCLNGISEGSYEKRAAKLPSEPHTAAKLSSFSGAAVKTGPLARQK